MPIHSEEIEMTQRTAHIAALGLAVLLVLPLAAMAAGGSSTSAPSNPPRDPRAMAQDSYNRALKYRDKAWEFESMAAAATSDADRDKYENKAAKEYKKAIRALSSAVDEDPALHQAHSSLGYALRKTGDYDGSLVAYNRALQLNPGYTEAIEYRAEAFLGLNRLDEAKDAYLQLFRDDRKRADELMEAMESWLTERQADPAGVETAVLEGFSGWLEERRQIASQMGGAPGSSW